ncbi:hypothetical protein KAI92_02040 [Candidatus Parcubacteria bacterium]|nr:hypothetical protein [Candidatus Parcubacteria bacterium]
MSSDKKQKLARKHISTTTQQFLDISEIKEDVVVMRDGTLRAILLVSSINFSLKNEDEQNATISAYVGFLNSVEFPIQIVIQSRELNIERYLKELEEKEKEQTNELLKMQTSEYIQYINELVSISSIMNKRFYVAIPYNPLTDNQKSFVNRFSELFKPAIIIRMKEKKFKKRKVKMMTRVTRVQNGLGSIGLHSVQLDTQSLIELYYNSYNPETSKNQKLVDINQLKVVK